MALVVRYSSDIIADTKREYSFYGDAVKVSKKSKEQYAQDIFEAINSGEYTRLNWEERELSLEDILERVVDFNGGVILNHHSDMSAFLIEDIDADEFEEMSEGEKIRLVEKHGYAFEGQGIFVSVDFDEDEIVYSHENHYVIDAWDYEEQSGESTDFQILLNSVA